jgi:hypothetical protein
MTVDKDGSPQSRPPACGVAFGMEGEAVLSRRGSRHFLCFSVYSVGKEVEVKDKVVSA